MVNKSDHVKSNYTRTRILLHWLSAIIILWTSITGFLSSRFSPHSPLREFFDTINPQITTLFIPFFIWRAVLYLRALPWSGWSHLHFQERVAQFTHGVLYLLISFVLATGVVMMSKPWSLLGLFPMPIAGIESHFFFFLHKLLCISLAAVIALHLSAVMYHICKGHNILRNMSLWSRHQEPVHEVDLTPNLRLNS